MNKEPLYLKSAVEQPNNSIPEPFLLRKVRIFPPIKGILKMLKF